MEGRRGARGFSLIEILVVVGIGLVVMAISLPSLMSSYRIYQMGSALRDTTNIISRARYEALRRNRPINTIFAWDLNRNAQLGIDLNANAALDADEPRVIVPPGITLVQPTAGTTFFASVFSMGPGYLPQNLGIPDGTGLAPGPFAIRFTERGTAMTWSSGRIVPIAVLFFQNNAGDWGAVTVSPMGGVRSWRTDEYSQRWH